MNLKKTMCFLAVAFLLVDVLLLVLCVRTRSAKLYLSDAMLEDAASYLESCGVSVEPEVIHKKIPDNPVYTFRKDNVTLAYGAASRLSTLYFFDASVSFAETPDGVSYTIGETGAPQASFRVYQDSFRLEYVRTGFQKELMPDGAGDAFASKDVTLTRSEKRGLSAFLEALSASKSAGGAYSVRGVIRNENGVLVCVSQNVYDDHRISDMYFNLFLTDNGVEYATGSRVLASFVRSYGEKLIDGVNALYSINLSEVSRILSQNIVYENRSLGNGIYYLIPRWEIVYLDHSSVERTQYMDALKK